MRALANKALVDTLSKERKLTLPNLKKKKKKKNSYNNNRQNEALNMFLAMRFQKTALRK